MVELSTSRVFDVSNPVEALEYDLLQCQLIVSSQHGNYALYDMGKNGKFQLALFTLLSPLCPGTMVCLWQATIDCNKAAYIAKSVRFYKSGQKVLIFVL